VTGARSWRIQTARPSKHPASRLSQPKFKQNRIIENKVIRECASFDHSLVFAKANGADIPPTSKGAGYVATLGNIYTQLVNAGATQKPLSVSAQNALILALDQKLDNMAATAKAYASIEPGFDDLFPRCAHLNPGEVMRTANAFLAKLAPVTDDDAAATAAKAARVQVFVDHGTPDTLVADLQPDLENIGTATGTREQSREQGVLSTEQISQLVVQGQVQRDLLGAIFRTVYSHRPDKLAVWVSASHVEHASHHAAKPAPAPTPATATGS